MSNYSTVFCNNRTGQGIADDTGRERREPLPMDELQSSALKENARRLLVDSDSEEEQNSSFNMYVYTIQSILFSTSINPFDVSLNFTSTNSTNVISD